MVKINLRSKCFKKRRATELTESNKRELLGRSKRLAHTLSCELGTFVHFIWFTDEKLIAVASPITKPIVKMIACLLPLEH